MRRCIHKVRRLAAVAGLAALILGTLPGGADAAVAEFFWAGFNISDPGVNKSEVEGVLYKDADLMFRSRNKGSIAPLLGGLKWDEFSYFETASETGYVKENMRDVYGVFVSVDRVMRFSPSVVDIGGKTVKKYYTYIFVTLNVFAADSRNLVFSHPLFLTDVFEQPPDVPEVLRVTLGKFAMQLKNPANPYTQKIAQSLQAYFGPPGVSLEAIRRTKSPIHAIDDYFANTFGVMALCEECVGVADKSGMTKPNTAMMGDFARFFLNARLAQYRQVAFQPEQSRSVEERTGDAAATAKEGDIKRDWSEFCLPEYDETGKSRICVKVLPPRNPIWIGVRSLVKPSKGSGALVKLGFAAVVDIEAELAGRAQPLEARLAEMAYQVPAVQGEAVSNVYYINTLMKAINKMDEKTIR
ncbi:MAG: hypothetical protein HN377_02615 [Alphaproteobacteria bacterium]|jgi:hypothetical protein|nr:hypothetical protein [Alphaproteobacteria bacterium]